LRPLSLRLAKGLQLARIHHAVAVGVHALESAMQKLILLLGRQRREPTELRLPMLKALALLGRQGGFGGAFCAERAGQPL
jgi:hypothetical protein